MLVRRHIVWLSLVGSLALTSCKVRRPRNDGNVQSPIISSNMHSVPTPAAASAREASDANVLEDIDHVYLLGGGDSRVILGLSGFKWKVGRAGVEGVDVAAAAAQFRKRTPSPRPFVVRSPTRALEHIHKQTAQQAPGQAYPEVSALDDIDAFRFSPGEERVLFVVPKDHALANKILKSKDRKLFSDDGLTEYRKVHEEGDEYYIEALDLRPKFHDDAGTMQDTFLTSGGMHIAERNWRHDPDFARKTEVVRLMSESDFEISAQGQRGTLGDLEYEVVGTLGGGTYGTVYRVKFTPKAGGEAFEVAVKKQKDPFSKEEIFDGVYHSELAMAIEGIPNLRTLAVGSRGNFKLDRFTLSYHVKEKPGDDMTLEITDTRYAEPVPFVVRKGQVMDRLQTFYDEVNYTSGMSRHPNSTGYYGAYTAKASTESYMVLELMEGNLDKAKSLTPAEKSAMAPEVFRSLVPLHAERRIYYDGKAQNVLYNTVAGGTATVKRGDFGLTQEGPAQGSLPNPKHAGTYSPPEFAYTARGEHFIYVRDGKKEVFDLTGYDPRSVDVFNAVLEIIDMRLLQSATPGKRHLYDFMTSRNAVRFDTRLDRNIVDGTLLAKGIRSDPAAFGWKAGDPDMEYMLTGILEAAPNRRPTAQEAATALEKIRAP